MFIAPDVVSLRAFYATGLGECVRRDVGAAIARHWGDVTTWKRTCVIGLGFASPYLRPALESNACVLSVMFPHIGGMYWPVDSTNHSVLAAENELPLEDRTVHRLVLVHALEHSPHVATLMNEVFRVLTYGGKALFIVPNRRGVWSRASNNPFGFGHPYHGAQVRHRAELAGLTYIGSSSALFYPPSHIRPLLRTSEWMERFGRCFLPHMGGVSLVEVENQPYATIPEPAKRFIIAPQLQPHAAMNAKTPNLKSPFNQTQLCGNR
jgi:SAM-dependent methyltransferase